MSHNYATPLTPEKRLARVLTRIPTDWVVNIDRQPSSAGTGQWRARLTMPGHEAQDWTAPHEMMVDALEAAWRQARTVVNAAMGKQDTVNN
ncbi:hypothetical protein [Komagataeibacter oboediens]|uniref:Uncharacterized protein n=1 Tax=Komagataeibacter oboediens TaxID=65958 RepID=A0ABS5SJM2_9PROT|nr:hypothetical protein [Komagataeibacter oboediens]MBL7234593.1 hypothetical protein [Komagataeibacter oboediens]MBT0674429.1 hypothetical protein [Komagataeibacter oboediens]MBT0678080.1 hypothetical protein [Komagataeibacter oboediens]